MVLGVCLTCPNDATFAKIFGAPMTCAPSKELQTKKELIFVRKEASTARKHR